MFWREMRYCLHPKLSRVGDITSSDQAAVSSIDGYGEIETGPKFGCVHHKPC